MRSQMRRLVVGAGVHIAVEPHLNGYFIASFRAGFLVEVRLALIFCDIGGEQRLQEREFIIHEREGVIPDIEGSESAESIQHEKRLNCSEATRLKRERVQ